MEERLFPKLRSFAPAMHAFCLKGNIAGALEVDAMIAAAKIEITVRLYKLHPADPELETAWLQPLETI